MSEVVKMCEKGAMTCCRALAVMAMLFCAVAALPSLADGNRRPMALMVMFDGLRADAIESGEMPNLAALRNGTWQPGYNAAWTVTGQNAPGTPPVSAPNHASIATGVSPSKHGVTANGKTASGNYAAYPTWLKRVVDAKSGTSALFVYSWSEDADLGPAAGVTFLGKTDAENATDLAALLASSDAPDATMYFIDAVDHAGHAGSYYPYTAGYRAALAESDGYLGACLSAIASRATFADEDWLILVTSDHGGFGTTHAERGGRHDHRSLDEDRSVEHEMLELRLQSHFRHRCDGDGGPHGARGGNGIACEWRGRGQRERLCDHVDDEADEREVRSEDGERREVRVLPKQQRAADCSPQRTCHCCEITTQTRRSVA